MLDKAPKPLTATCSFLNYAIVHSFRDRVCEPHREPDFLRNFHTMLERLDYTFGTGLGWNPVAVFPCCALYKWTPCSDFANAIHELFLQLWLSCIHPNTSTSDSAPALSENLFRNSCTHGMLFSDATNFGIAIRKLWNSKDSVFQKTISALLRSHFRIECSSSEQNKRNVIYGN